MHFPSKSHNEALLNSRARISRTAAAILAIGELLRGDDPEQGLSSTARDGIGCLLEILGNELFDRIDAIPATMEGIDRMANKGAGNE